MRTEAEYGNSVAVNGSRLYRSLGGGKWDSNAEKDPAGDSGARFGPVPACEWRK